MHAKFGLIHWRVATTVADVARGSAGLRDQRGQGTVEYVGLVLLVAVLMGGMVAAVGGLNSLPGKELAEAITKKIVQAVQKVTFAR
jgi:Flp pilus assembly pilin Flp